MEPSAWFNLALIAPQELTDVVYQVVANQSDDEDLTICCYMEAAPVDSHH